MSQETAIDAQELNKLEAALLHHLRKRCDVPDGDIRTRSIAYLLSALPAELGQESADTLPAFVHEGLTKQTVDEWPEIFAARIWLNAIEIKLTQHDTDGITVAMLDGMWPPLRARCFRIMSHFGLRIRLAHLLNSLPRQSLDFSDARLESSLPGSISEDKIGIAKSDRRKVAKYWQTLLNAEWNLGKQVSTPECESRLQTLLTNLPDAGRRSWAAWEKERIAGRAWAALIRARLACCGEVMNRIDEAASHFAPRWLRLYLQALVSWQQKKTAAAIQYCRQSQDANPYQTPVRLALATLLSTGGAEEALAVCEHPQPTWELRLTQAVLFARVGRVDDCRQALGKEGEAEDVPREPIRFRWTNAQAYYRRLELRLRQGLAEQKGQYAQAARLRQKRIAENDPRAKNPSREWFVARVEHDAVPSHREEYRKQIRHRLEQLRRKSLAAPATGDARFFRGLAQLPDHPIRAQSDLCSLLESGSWVARDQRTGSHRLAAIGDALLRVGYAEDAHTAYGLADAHGQFGERRLIASILHKLMCETALDDEASFVEKNPWAGVMITIGTALLKSHAEAKLLLQRARQAGAAPHVCDAIQASLNGTSIEDARIPRAVGVLMTYLISNEDEATRRRQYFNNAGTDWHQTAPFLLCQWAADQCKQGNHSAVAGRMDRLNKQGRTELQDLRVLVEVDRALANAEKGQLHEANQLLRALEES